MSQVGKQTSRERGGVSEKAYVQFCLLNFYSQDIDQLKAVIEDTFTQSTTHWEQTKHYMVVK